MLTGTIRTQVDAIWDKFWTGGVTNPISVIEQISYLLFIKRLDELQNTLDRKVMLGAKVDKHLFSEEQQPLRWSKFKDNDPEVMFQLVQHKVFPFIKNLHGEDSSLSQHMKNAIFMIPRAELLDQVVQLIDTIPMDDSDTKGDLYEYLLSKLKTSGVNGQFRTPRHIIKMMVELMQPKLDDTVCDPASGTCGFLMATAEYMRENHQQALLKEEHQQHFQNKMLNAYDFDAHMLRIGAMNLASHGIEHAKVEYRDSLAEDENEIKEAYSLILANPPFKGSVDFDLISSNLLTALGKDPKKKVATSKDSEGNKKTKKPTEKSELLFLALILRMLKTGGRCAVIVPDGVLFGSTKSHQAIRQKLVDEQKLEAVISMPSGVFKPYAGVSTAILLFTKTNSGGTKNVWFYDMKQDGISLDDKRNPLLSEEQQTKHYNTFKNNTEIDNGLHEKDNIPDIIQRWRNQEPETKRTKKEQSFNVDVADIIANGYDLSINRYKEVVYKEVKYDSPKTIVDRIKALQASMDKGLIELEKLL
jgi:type I restriction enzyme M protein